MSLLDLTDRGNHFSHLVGGEVASFGRSSSRRR